MQNYTAVIQKHTIVRLLCAFRYLERFIMLSYGLNTLDAVYSMCLRDLDHFKNRNRCPCTMPWDVFSYEVHAKSSSILPCFIILWFRLHQTHTQSMGHYRGWSIVAENCLFLTDIFGNNYNNSKHCHKHSKQYTEDNIWNIQIKCHVRSFMEVCVCVLYTCSCYLQLASSPQCRHTHFFKVLFRHRQKCFQVNLKVGHNHKVVTIDILINQPPRQ